MVVVASSINFRCQYQQPTTQNHARSSNYTWKFPITPRLWQSYLIEADSPVTVDASDAYTDSVESLVNSHPNHVSSSSTMYKLLSSMLSPSLTNSSSIYSYTSSSRSSSIGRGVIMSSLLSKTMWQCVNDDGCSFFSLTSASIHSWRWSAVSFLSRQQANLRIW